MGQRAQRDYSRMQLAELSGRMRRLDNLRSLNNPWMVWWSQGLLSACERNVPQLWIREEEECEPLALAPGKVTACLDAPAKLILSSVLADTRGPADARDPGPG